MVIQYEEKSDFFFNLSTTTMKLLTSMIKEYSESL